MRGGTRGKPPLKRPGVARLRVAAGKRDDYGAAWLRFHRSPIGLSDS
jgi:hypothetical protein